MNRDGLKKTKIETYVYSALFSALVCIATMAIRLPVPGVGGYIHFGDAFVIMAGIILGSRAGGAAGALGSAIADVLSGYAIYAPASFIIKGAVAFVSGLIYKRSGAPDTVRCILCGLVSIVFVTAGYLGFELVLYGAGAFAGVTPNLIQSGGGLVIACFLRPVMEAAFRHVK